MNQITIKRTQQMDIHNGRHSKGTINIGKPAVSNGKGDSASPSALFRKKRP